MSRQGNNVRSDVHCIWSLRPNARPVSPRNANTCAWPRMDGRRGSFRKKDQHQQLFNGTGRDAKVYCGTSLGFFGGGMKDFTRTGHDNWSLASSASYSSTTSSGSTMRRCTPPRMVVSTPNNASKTDLKCSSHPKFTVARRHLKACMTVYLWWHNMRRQRNCGAPSCHTLTESNAQARSMPVSTANHWNTAFMIWLRRWRCVR
mmetsp:Transcript_18653/g.58575  ORF Transcript_18653/g.58575 Transcript_18653/m.58575 type:complete len:203 (-) Transcript_18653:57-665(-)